MKVLILTASPQRDAIIDRQLKDELTKRGHEAFVRPCLREGRDAVLELKPDVVVVPPIRNPYSRDFVETCKGWGIGVITRHTEASCSKKDFDEMDDYDKQRNIFGLFKYGVDAEVVWGHEEAEILKGRGCKFPIVPVGSLAVDAYFKDELIKEFSNRETFAQKLGIDPKKKTVLVGSSWGFADSAPDLRIEETNTYFKEDDGRDKFIAFIKDLREKLNWNIILRPHPGVDPKPYKEKLPDLVIETEMMAIEMLCNCDLLIHSGSTMALEAHFLGIPAYQFGDVNRKFANNWFQKPDSPLSKVSPHITCADDMLKFDYKRGSNADVDILNELSEGRYGLMDGKATSRLCDVVEKVSGSFKLCWPKAHVDYDMPHAFKSVDKLTTRSFCNICNNPFHILNQSWANKFFDGLGMKRIELPEEMNCPNCGSRMFRQ
jgi:surface carbohydrate biosynthesis protein